MGVAASLDVHAHNESGSEVLVARHQPVEARIEAGRSKFSLRVLAAEDFPRLSEVAGSGVRMDAAALAEALRQVIPADVLASRGPSNPSSGNAAAVAPAGQRPRAGTVASCAHETTPAATDLDAIELVTESTSCSKRCCLSASRRDL